MGNLMDPLDYETGGTRYIRTSDAQQETASSIGDVSLATSKGSTTELYAGMGTSWEKSAGLGDIEYLQEPIVLTTVSGYVYNDINGDGTKLPTENGLGAHTYVKVCRSDNTFITSTSADSVSGVYSFSGLTDGDYILIEDASNAHDCDSMMDAAGWTSTTPNTIAITVSGTDITSQNFGNKKEAANAFVCNQDGHIFNTPDYKVDNFSKGYVLDLDTATLNFNQQFGKRHINAIGYNVNDDFIYGIGDSSDYHAQIELIKVDKNYNVESIPITGLPQGKSGYAHGDVSFDNKLYFGEMFDENEVFHYLDELMIIDLSSYTLEAPIPLIYPAGTQMIYSADFAFNPKDNMLYTVNALNNQLVRINPTTGLVEELGYIGAIPDTYSVVAFFDIDGRFFFTDELGTKLYTIDISDPSTINTTAAVYANGLSLPGSGDGAKCAYSKGSTLPEPVAEFRFDDCGDKTTWMKDYSITQNDAIGTVDIQATDFKDYMCSSIVNAGRDVAIPDHAAYDMDEGTISILLYDNHNISANARLIEKGWDPINKLSMVMNPVGGDITKGTIDVNLSGNMINTNDVYYTTLNNGTDDDTQWTHIALTFGSQGMKLYINGALKGTNTYTGGINGIPGDIAMPGLSGHFDEFYMFDGQMNDTQVSELYNNLISNKNIDGTLRDCGCDTGNITEVVNEVCPVGYTLDTSVNYAPNGDFSILENGIDAPPGTWLSGSTWKSGANYQKLNQYPNDTDSSTSMNCSIVYDDIINHSGVTNVFRFPGNAEFQMGSQNVLCVNGNDTGNTITSWESQNINVLANNPYIFVAHFSNNLYKPKLLVKS